MRTIGDRVRERRLELRWSQSKLAKLIGAKNASTISELESGRSKKSTSTTLLAKVMGLNAQWLQTGRGDRLASIDLEEGHEDIIGFAQTIATGDGQEVEEWVSTHKLKFRASSLARKNLDPKRLAVYYSVGVSMEPRIHAGDAIMVNLDESDPNKIVDDAAYLFKYDEHMQAKRLRRSGKTIIAIGDNSPPFIIDETRPFQLIGRIRWIGSWEGYPPPKRIRSFDHPPEFVPMEDDYVA